MKFLLTFLLIGSFGFISFSSNQKKKLFIKNVWSTIDTNGVNRPLFYPVNEQEYGFDDYQDEYIQSELEHYRERMKSNLFNVLRYLFLTDQLTIYYPYNPNWVVTKDKGFMFFPLNFGSQSYYNNPEFEEEVKYSDCFGTYIYDYNPVALIDSWGYDSLDQYGNTVYPAPDFEWIIDKDIIEYQIREEYIVDENEKLKAIHLKAIAPVVFQRDWNTGEILGKKTLFWVSTDQLIPLLKDFYFSAEIKQKKKVISLQDFLEDRLYESTIYETDSNYYKIYQP